MQKCLKKSIAEPVFPFFLKKILFSYLLYIDTYIYIYCILVVLDQTTRNKNIQHHLNELERDNYAEVPELEIVSGTITKPRRTVEVDTSQSILVNVIRCKYAVKNSTVTV